MMTAQQITILVLLPASPDPRSNGIQCYLSLVGPLKLLPGVAYTSGPGYNDLGTAHYMATWQGHYIPESLLLQDKTLLAALRVVLLPDHIDGLACQIYDYLRCEGSDTIRYINMVLAPLYVFSDQSLRPIETMYDNRDLFVYFNKHFLPSGYHAMDIYQEPNSVDLHKILSAIEVTVDHNSPPNCKNAVIYAGKGHYAIDHSASCAISEIKSYLDSRGLGLSLITRSWPESKHVYLQLMAESIGLILLDPFTNVIRDALMLGVPVFSTLDGIDYECFGVSRDATSFINSLANRKSIREHAWSRHFSLSRFNLLKQSLFFESIRKLLIDQKAGLGSVFIPYTAELQQASLLFARDLLKQCVVGSLCTATQAVTSADEAIEIMINPDSSAVAAGYRQVANNYYEQD
jgi:hypothetical protein